MRVPIPHSLDKEEVRRRLRTRTGELAGFIPGGVADVATDWPDDDTMNLTVTALGKTVAGTVEIAERQVVFSIDLPGALSFIEPAVRTALEQKGRKLLT